MSSPSYKGVHLDTSAGEHGEPRRGTHEKLKAEVAMAVTGPGMLTVPSYHPKPGN